MMQTTIDKPISTAQINQIMRNCNYQIEIKNEWVQLVTGDNNRTSLHSLSEVQAAAIISKQTGVPVRAAASRFELFDGKNSKHRLILSLAIQAQWSLPHKKHGKIADMKRVAHFLQSDRSPVRVPLVDQTSEQLSITIVALEGIVKSKYK